MTAEVLVERAQREIDSLSKRVFEAEYMPTALTILIGCSNRDDYEVVMAEGARIKTAQESYQRFKAKCINNTD